MPTKTPVGCRAATRARARPRGAPRSPRSSSSRCCGSIAAASAGDTPNAALSNRSAPHRKPPCRTRRATVLGAAERPSAQRDAGTSPTGRAARRHAPRRLQAARRLAAGRSSRDQRPLTSSAPPARAAARRGAACGGALRAQERGELARRRVVEDQRARQRRLAPHRLLQLVAQLDRAQRVEARLHQRRVRIDRAARRALHERQHRLQRQAAAGPAPGTRPPAAAGASPWRERDRKAGTSPRRGRAPTTRAPSPPRRQPRTSRQRERRQALRQPDQPEPERPAAARSPPPPAAIPTSAHGPHCTLVAACPAPRRPLASASRQLFAAA